MATRRRRDGAQPIGRYAHLHLAAERDEEEALPRVRTIAASGDAIVVRGRMLRGGVRARGVAMVAGLKHSSPVERTQPAMTGHDRP